MILPRGLYTLSVAGRLSRETVQDSRYRFGQGGVDVGVGFGAYDVGFGADFLVFQDDNLPEMTVVPKFQRVSANASRRLYNNSYIGVSGVLGSAFTEYRRYSPSLFIGNKTRTSEKIALYASGGVDYNYGNSVSAGGERYVSHRLGAYAGVTLRRQATPVVAMDLSASIAEFKYIDSQHVRDDTYGVVSGNAAVRVSASETMDVSVFAGLSSVGSVSIVAGGLAISVRTMP